MREMVGGCCVCSDERGWAENPLVYCDGHGCNVAVHQACYGIVQVPTGPWFCRKCESQERAARVRCELCPHKDGALKRTDSGGWAHVVCALYIPEVQFANVLTMEPIILQYVPHERYMKTCYICEDHGRESKAACGACMACNRQGCRQAFHVTCAQMAGLLCEEEGPEADNVKYCGYCKRHYNKMKRRSGENPGSTSAHSGGRSASPSQDRRYFHRQRKSHKEKMRPKERHWQSSGPQEALRGTGSVGPTDALSSSHGADKDGESKSKNVTSHSHHAKKTGSNGRSSSSSRSSSPFLPGGAPSSVQDFHQYSSSSSRPERDHRPGGDHRHLHHHHHHHAREDRKERHRRPPEDEKGDEKSQARGDEERDHCQEEEAVAAAAATPAEGPRGHRRSDGNAGPFENKVTISTFGSVMRITSTSVLGGSGSGGGGGGSSKIRKISSSGDHRTSKSLCKLAPRSTPPIPGEAEPAGESHPPPSQERRHRGGGGGGSDKKSRHGPGRPRGSKNRVRKEHARPRAALPPPPPPASSYRDPTSLPPGPASSSSYPEWTSAPRPAPSPSDAGPSSSAGPGIYGSLKKPLSLLGGSVCGAAVSSGGGACGASPSSGLLPGQARSIQSSDAVSIAQAHPAWSGPYGAQGFIGALSAPASRAAASLTESEPDDCRFPCQGNSPRESLCSRSPVSSLPLLFGQRDGGGGGGPACGEDAPRANAHIELLLEKHSDGEFGVNIVDILQSLHSLQQENQRLQEQILSLTAKRERLQSLNTELALPFPHAHPGRGSFHAVARLNSSSCARDHLTANKSPPSKSAFLNEPSFVTSSEDLRSASPSRSGSSLSFRSTPPPQPSPADAAPSQAPTNGRAWGDGAGGSLTGSPQPGANGALDADGVVRSPVRSGGGGGSRCTLPALRPQPSRNGAPDGAVARSPVRSGSQGTLPALRPQAPPLDPQTTAQSSQVAKSGSPSEQHKHVLLEQQVQQFLASQNLTPEQRAVVCQLLHQRQRQQRQQRLTASAPANGAGLFGRQDARSEKAPGDKNG
ncbi:protein AF-17-like isoform X2 [Stigmatopora nigra]